MENGVLLGRVWRHNEAKNGMAAKNP
ncbi:uncharacterized protein G2W53_039215 [Senna tora]|uniref:Uncharacterized protein n=1 Tax=Senna tora TaxID=362788 RepID=A0A834SN85_9FABA|nr:uncharacterized protein G2W53_039215 [Senna tora]